MATTQPLIPDPTDPTDRWAKQNGLRGGATGWTADALQGKQMAPPASPMQSVANGLRAGTTPTAAPVASPTAPKYTPPPVNPTTGRYTQNEQVLRSPGLASEAANLKSGVTDLAGAGSPSASNPAAGRPGIVQSVRNGLRSAGGFVTGAGDSGGSVGKVFGNVLGGATDVVKGLAPMAGGLARIAAPVAAAYDASQIYGTDTGTYDKRFGLQGGADRGLLGDLAVRGAGAASDLTNSASFGGLRYLHDKMYGEGHWDGKSEQNQPPAPAAPALAATNPIAAPETYPQANATSSARTLRQGDPSSSDLNDIHSNAMIENRNPDGKVTKVGNSYSGGNVSGEVSFQGADGNALRGRPGGGYMSSSAEDGAARLSEARASLRNPDGSSWSASDNAIMAANLRDGVDKYRGTSRDTRGAGADKYANMPIKMATAMRVQDAQAAAQRENTNTLNQTTLRGQDMDYERAMAPIKLQAQMRRYSADIFKAAGGDNAKAARMMQAAGLDPKQFLDVQKSELDNSTSQQAQLKAAREASKDMFKGDFVKKDKDGNDSFDEVGESRARQLLNQLTGGTYDQMGEAEQQAYRTEARGKADMLGQIRTPKLRGAVDVIGNKIGLVNDPVNLSTLPDFSGGTAVRRGLGMTMGVDSGSWDVTDAHGKVHNFKNLDKNQINILRKAGVTVPTEK